ncbi:MAG: hypothetical protein E7Z89_03485 [Cyanobacteria bacterium SIG28]|nr:hypothetical protein [Cyanobacteria bacterium SIG28]
MRVSAIQKSMVRQNSVQKQATKPRCLKQEPEQIPEQATANPAFKGSNGALLGLGGGLITGLATVGGAAIAGVLVLPAAIGGLAIVATGAAGAAAGNKIEDKIKGKK